MFSPTPPLVSSQPLALPKTSSSRMPQVVQAPVLHIHCASVEGGLPFHFEKASPSLYSGSEGSGDNEEGKEEDLIDIEESREYNREEDRERQERCRGGCVIDRGR